MTNDSTSAHTFYAVCDCNGPISVRIEADSVEGAVARWETMDARALIDSASTDAEDDLDIAGEGMDEGAFAAALEAAGCARVRDLDAVHNAHAGTTAHLAGGWYLWSAPADPLPGYEAASVEREEMLDAALAGIEVTAAGGVVRVRDGNDTWLCREAEWDAMVERVRSGAVRLSGADEDGYCDDYSTICAAVRGPVITLHGTPRGSAEERAELLSSAIEAELLLEIDAERYGVAL